MKIPEETIRSVEDFLKFGEFSGTESFLYEIVGEVLNENKFNYPYADEVEVVDWFGDNITDRMLLSDFVGQLWLKMVDGVVNVLETEE